MRVFVAGASGVIGRALVPQLVAAGHATIGMTRSEGRAAAIRAAGAEAVVCDAFDAPALAAAVEAAAPDVVVHQLTALPHRFEPRKRGLYDATNRVRAEGTRNLIAAAAGRRIVCQSVAFAYRPAAGVVDEDAPLYTDALEPFGSGTRVIADMERMVLDVDGLVLRYGWFYGPGTFFGSGGSMEHDVRKRRFPLVGDGGGLWSFRRVPVWLATLIAGKAAARMSGALPGASNARAKRELAWEPGWASWRTGFREAPR
jgi:nucleoside-diphosphate-sugar epimerase